MLNIYNDRYYKYLIKLQVARNSHSGNQYIVIIINDHTHSNNDCFIIIITKGSVMISSSSIISISIVLVTITTIFETLFFKCYNNCV